MNRRVALAWKWTLASVAAAAACTGLAMWIARADTRPVDPGARDVAGLTDELARGGPSDLPRLRFVDHAERLGLPAVFRGVRTHQLPEDMGGGVAVADLDGDARPDVLLVGCGALPDGGPCLLFRNETPSPGAAVALRDVTEGSGLPALIPGMGVALGDTDGDGDLDVLLTRFGGVTLLRNEGGMRFTDVTAAHGLAAADGWCAGACFGDLDGDDDLDLYVCRYVDYRRVEGRPDLPMYGLKVPYTLNPFSFQPATKLLYLNRGDGTFEGGEAAAEAWGVGNPTGRSLTAVAGDFDLDGVPDLYVANDVSDNAMFQGEAGAEGRRGFRDMGARSATADHRGAMGLAVADGDGDGDDEIFITHWLAQENAYYRNFARDARTGGRRMLFTDDADRVGLGAIALDYVGWTTDFVDFDLDGSADLFVANGSTLEDAKDSTRLVPQRPLVFWNAGPRRGFFEAGRAWGDVWTAPRGLRGGAAADLDGDGDSDLVLGAVEGRPMVLVNEGPPAARGLVVELRAAAPNTFGIGARVTVLCEGREQSREMRSSPGYVSAGPPEIRFGLGTSASPAIVRVRWPNRTLTETLTETTTETTVPPAERRVVVRRP